MKKTGIFLLTLAVGGTAHASDVTAGKSKSITCMACHGGDGIGTDPLRPNLAGQKKRYLVQQLKAFRDGSRVNPTMEAMAKMLSDKDIEDLATYFSSLPAGGQ